MDTIKERLIYGCMNIGGSWNQDKPTMAETTKGIKALEAAYDLGIRQYDHANIYMMGKSETVFSEFMKETGVKREDLHIQTKVGIVITDKGNYYDFSKEHIISETEKCLERLNMTYVDRLLLHRPDVIFEPMELKEALDDLFNRGLIKEFGVSNMSKDQIKVFEKVTGRQVAVNQLELSLKRNEFVGQWVDFNTEAYKNDILNGTIEHCMLKNITLQAWGSMAQGIFSGKAHTKETPKTVVESSKYVEKLAFEKNTSKENIVLSWLLKHPAMIQPIIGSVNPERIMKLQGLMAVNMTKEEWYNLYTMQRGHNLP